MRKRLKVLIAAIIVTVLLVVVSFSLTNTRATSSSNQITWDTKADFESNASTTGESTARGNVAVSDDGKVSIKDINPQLRVADDTILTESSEAETPGTVASDTLGNSVIVWGVGEVWNGTSAIYAKKIDNDGNTLIPPFKVNNVYASTELNYPAQVAIAPNGDFTIAYVGHTSYWLGYGFSPYIDDIYAKRFNSLGQVLLEEFKVSSSTSGYTYNNQCQLAVDSEGNMVFSWVCQYRAGGDWQYEVLLKKLDPSGNVLIPETRVDTNLEGRNTNPQVGVDAQGNIYLIWKRQLERYGENDEIFFKKYSSVGDVLVTETQVDDNILGKIDQYRPPRLAVRSDGAFYILWERENSQADYLSSQATKVLVKKYESNGAASPQQVLGTGWNASIGRGVIKVLPEGNFSAIWRDDNSWYGTKLNGDYATAGTIKQLKIDAGEGNKYRWDKIKWQTTSLPQDSLIKARLRSADSKSGLDGASWSPFYTASGTDISDAVEPSRFLELELMLTASSDNQSPVLDSLTVEYSPLGAGHTKTWDSQADFSQGTKTQVDVTPDGKIKLAKATKFPALNFTSSGDNQNATNYGWSVSSAGDVDGDGYDDVIVGAEYYDSAIGKAYVYPGGPSGFSPIPTWTAVGECRSDAIYNSRFGSSVSSAGDVNGDGYDDVIVGAPCFETWGGGRGGKAYLYLGSASGLSEDPVWTSLGDSCAYAFFGESVSSAGDVNGDGYDDVIVGAWGYPCYYTDSRGKAYLYLGGELGLSATPDWTSTGDDQAYFKFGSSVSSAGDVNGDGYDDVIVGAPGRAKTFLYLGGASGLSTNAAWTVSESSQSDFGCSVSSAGDVNGDGFDDVIVGARRYSNSSGVVYCYLGSASGLSDTPAWIISGDGQYGNSFGNSVSSAGDVNGDGYDDVIVGASGYNNRGGKAYLYVGGPSGLTPYWFSSGDDQINAWFGYSVSSAGDVNNDGYSDFIVGAPQFNANTGKAYGYLANQEEESYYYVGTLANLKIDAGSENIARWRKIDWNATASEGAHVKFRVRSADTEEALASAPWSAFVTANEKDWQNNIADLVKASRWLEVMLYISSDNPEALEVDSVTVSYTLKTSKAGPCNSCHSNKLPPEEFNTKNVTLDKCIPCHAHEEAWGDVNDFYEGAFGYFYDKSSIQLSNPRTVRKIHEWHGYDGENAGDGEDCAECHSGVACTACHDEPVGHLGHPGASYPGANETYSKGHKKGTFKANLSCTNQNCHGSMTKGNFTYRPSCKNCHYRDKTDRVDKYIEQVGHGDINQKHSKSGLASDCKKCHKKDNVATYHTENKQKTCDSCHKSTNYAYTLAVRKNNPTCTNCHSTYHSDIETKHTYSSISSNCLVCHDKSLIKEHEKRKKGCSICHEDTTKIPNPGSRKEKAVASGNKDCFACHTGHPVGGNNCTVCHGEAFSCTSCHMDKERHRDKVNCEDCHLNGFEVHHGKESMQTKGCADCHAVAHAKEACISCHKEVQHKKSFSTLEAALSIRGGETPYPLLKNEGQISEISSNFLDKLSTLVAGEFVRREPKKSFLLIILIILAIVVVASSVYLYLKVKKGRNTR